MASQRSSCAKYLNRVKTRAGTCARVNSAHGFCQYIYLRILDDAYVIARQLLLLAAYLCRSYQWLRCGLAWFENPLAGINARPTASLNLNIGLTHICGLVEALNKLRCIDFTDHAQGV